MPATWKQTACTDWAMEYFVGLASCLYPFAGRLSVGLVGNCVDYQSMALPWGARNGFAGKKPANSIALNLLPCRNPRTECQLPRRPTTASAVRKFLI